MEIKDGEVSKELLGLMPKGQWEVMASSGEFKSKIEEMEKVVAKIPNIGETDNLERHPLALHYFSASSDWYISEWDRGEQFFGYAVLNGDVEMSEWGYISKSDLLGSETALLRLGDFLNLDLWCGHETVEDALYEKDSKYFMRYRRVGQ